MPPFLPRKRQSSIPPDSPAPVAVKRPRLTDALDAESTNKVPSLNKSKTFSLGSDSDSSLSDIDSDEFEDVPGTENKPTATKAGDADAAGRSDVDDDEEIEWEDAVAADTEVEKKPTHVPMANGPIQLIMNTDDAGADYSAAVASSNTKTGPTRREKKARIHAHQMHVQFLMFHNAVRNSWIGDKTVQQTLVKQLPQQILREVERWRKASGFSEPEEVTPKSNKGKKRRKDKQEDIRSQRDWGKPSQRLEAGKADLSHGDPLIALMKILAAYWKKRFAITAPGLRKRGYGTKIGLRQEISSYRNEEHDHEKHGEKIANIREIREIAEKCEGSRDVGAQLFTALLRGLGIEARMVASLQPCGYGWTKAEQMVPRKTKQISSQNKSIEQDFTDSDDNVGMNKKHSAKRSAKRSKTKSRQLADGKNDTISIASDSEKTDDAEEDDDSVVDVTPSMPKAKKAKYDRDLFFPIYWTEVISPITNRVLPVSPLVLESSVASTPEVLLTFEPRGTKAEKVRQIIAYVVAHSSDGSAKDVTVRYLRKQLWPGKTKGFRYPVEKVPVYDKQGKVKRYEDFDWFKQVMNPYIRPHNTRTTADNLEDSSDLVPQQPEKKKEDDGVDTLQSLKASADFVLERFLRREEALRPEAEPVRTFTSGKGDTLKEEPVFRRADVERCLTAESWHKEGRRPKLGETAMKLVPVRAVTLTRKREAEEHERVTGEKQMQGLYSWDQTEYIIPPAIKDGIIPKNGYGNMDCFVPSMVPKGAVHIPLKGTVRICKKLEIDFAEAVTGFEFGNKRAVPVCTGVVVAKENERLVREAWMEWNEEQRKKDETKMEQLVLGLWRKFVMGLRIRQRVADVYGQELGAEATGLAAYDPIQIDDDGQTPNETVSKVVDDNVDEEMGGGFLMPHEDDMSEADDLVLEHNAPHSKMAIQPPAPASSSANRKVGVTIASSSMNASSRLPSDDENASGHEDVSSMDDSESVDIAPPDVKPTTRVTGTKTSIYRFKPPTKSVIQQPENSSINSDEDEPGDEDEVDSDDQEPEEYVPKSTRSRQLGRPTKTNTTPLKKGNEKMKTPRYRTTNSNASTASKKLAASQPNTTTPTRRRGRPRKDGQSTIEPDQDHNPTIKAESNITNEKRVPKAKRSTKLLRKESTLVTSPYFEE